MGADESQLPLWLAIQSLIEQANRDALTGLYNRRYFEDALARQVEIASRYDRPLSLALLDIDHFKKVNDTEGHEAGDAILRKFADFLNTSVRKADLVCRYGGDEFAIILPETAIEHAMQFIERLASLLERSAACPGVTFTAGLAALPAPNLPAAADAALRARKKESRR